MPNDKDQLQQAQITALKAARRVIGFAQQAANPSQQVAKNVIKQLERALPATAAIKAKDLLREIVATNVLPSEKKAYEAGEEIRQLFDQAKQSPIEMQVESMTDSDDDHEQEHSSPRQ